MRLKGASRSQVFSFALGIAASGLATTPLKAWPQDPFSVVLVDKLKNRLHLAHYVSDHIEIRRSYHATLGKAQGDKEVVNDLKTPEGVYFFTGKLRPPGLKKKFGALALMMNYPNPVDSMAGKTGYDIMLHATDDPLRLKKNHDSEGCVVVDNAEIEEISRFVRLGETPIIIYPEMKDEHLRVDGNPEVRKAFQGWLEAWNGKDLDRYIGSYAGGFRYSGMNLGQYREHKRALNQRYAMIHVRAEEPRFYFHPKYDVVAFVQNYESRLKTGARGFRSSGTKLLYFVRDGGAYKIVNETYGRAK